MFPPPLPPERGCVRLLHLGGAEPHAREAALTAAPSERAEHALQFQELLERAFDGVVSLVELGREGDDGKSGCGGRRRSRQGKSRQERRRGIILRRLRRKWCRFVGVVLDLWYLVPVNIMLIIITKKSFPRFLKNFCFFSKFFRKFKTETFDY